MVVIVLELDLQLPVQSVPIITNVCEFESHPGEVYSIQNYVIKLVVTLSVTYGRLVVFSTNKTYHHDITEILLKVVLNTINQPNHLS